MSVYLGKPTDCSRCGAPTTGRTVLYGRVGPAGQTFFRTAHLGYCRIGRILALAGTPRDEFAFLWGEPPGFERVDDRGGTE